MNVNEDMGMDWGAIHKSHSVHFETFRFNKKKDEKLF